MATPLAGRYDLRFDIFRGDEFQVVLQQPEHVLLVASLVRLNLLAERLGKGRVNTTKLLNASSYNAITTYLQYAQTLIKDINRQYKANQ